MKIKKTAQLESKIYLGIVIGIALFMAFPLLITISNAFKPLEELLVFPPKIFVRNPTLSNFNGISGLLRTINLPLSRYAVNSVFIITTGVIGQVVLTSIAGYTFAKHTFPGSKFLFQMIVLSLMFSTTVTAVPNFIIMTKIKLIDTYGAIIIPAFASSLGLFLMKQFIEQMIPDSILEAARIDGSSEFQTFIRVVMPNCKPAWITLMIFSFQALWSTGGGIYIFTEKIKTLPFLFVTITSSTIISRLGVTAAVGLITILPPILMFVVSQSNVMSTMATSGMKD